MTSTRLALLAAIALPAATIAAAQDAPQVPGAVEPSRVEAGTYAADPDHSLVGWKVSHFGFTPYFGSFGNVEGTLEIDPTDLASARVDVRLPIDSLALVSDGLREHLLRAGKDGKDPDFFGPDAGEAHFVSTRVQPTSATEAIVYGDLTMNGHTRPIAIAASFSGAGNNPMSKALTVGFTGRAVIKRSEFGVSAFVPMVSDEVELELVGAFEKQ